MRDLAKARLQPLGKRKKDPNIPLSDWLLVLSVDRTKNGTGTQVTPEGVVCRVGSLEGTRQRQ